MAIELNLNPVIKISHQAKRKIKLERAIYRYRLVLAWFLALSNLLTIIGFDWDIQWHAEVGRDSFWTPPHWIIYISIAISGLICLFSVLIETFLYYRYGVKQNSIKILFLFHGSSGFSLAGFGVAALLIAAPFDDYWHRIYGIDVRIWTPFHIMFCLGELLIIFGLVYIFVSLINQNNSLQNSYNFQYNNKSLIYSLRNLLKPEILGLILVSTEFLTRYFLILAETVVDYGNLQLGNNWLPAYSLLLAPVPLIPISLQVFSLSKNYTGLVTIIGITFTLFKIIDLLLINWGIQFLAIDSGKQLRFNFNAFDIMPITYPNFLILAALVIELGYTFLIQKNSITQLTTFLRVGFISMVAAMVLFLLEQPWESYNNVVKDYANAHPALSKLILSQIWEPDYWQATPLVLLISFIAGLAGLSLGRFFKKAYF